VGSVMTTADYIIVGAGSAGCVLANRLSEDPRNKVVLIEAGGSDRDVSSVRSALRSLMMRIPVGWTSLLNDPAMTWGYVSEAEQSTGRTFPVTRGRVLGGSSSLNGMIYVRGLPGDYDGWRQQGCEGWSWDDVLPLFKAFERRRETAAGARSEKLLAINEVAYRHPLSYRIRDAFVQAGVPLTDDISGPNPDGVAFAHGMIDKGVRQSGSTAYLHPALGRPNLQVVTNAVARKVLFEGHRAVGIELDDPAGRRRLTATREVILAAGAIASPQLLELSGIGDGERLSELGIPVLHHSPAVGESLQDHFSASVTMRLKPGTSSMNEVSHGLRLLGHVGRYALRGEGLLTTTPAQIVALARSRPERDVPDLQFFASPATVDIQKTMERGRTVLTDTPGITMNCYQLRPSSRGSVHARTPDPAAHPRIVLNLVSDPMDQQTMVDGLRMSRRILGQPALAPLCDALSWDPERLDDAVVVDRIRQIGNTAYHYSGTCRMGGSDAVLTPRLAVRGVDGLRVVDASVMPSLVSGNTNAAVVMIAEKASIMIREDAASGR